MDDVSSLNVKLRHDDGTRQELTIDAPSALIGSGAHCEIRLPAEDAAVEQLRLTVDASGVFAQVRRTDRLVTLNGAPFIEGRLRRDSILRVGRVDLLVSLVETGVVRDAGGAQRKSTASRAIYALGAVGFPLGFYVLLGQQSTEGALPTEVSPPALLAAASAARCPEPAPDAALAVGGEELRRAEVARERAPFSGQDAVAAVTSFQRAASCFLSSGAVERAEYAKRQAEELENAVQLDFHVHRVRLERALVTKSYEEARTEVRLLLSYVGRHGSPYVSWLLTLDRQIELKFAGKRRK